ncbi:MAG: ArsR/SmtB family transcription factor [Candidatus Hodarchaeota archaeon]
MAEPNTQIIKFLKILCDETRLNILEHLKDGKKSSKQLEKLLRKKQSTISHHLTTLIEFSLVESEIKEIDKKNIHFYGIKNNDIFNLLSQIRNFIENANSKKFQERKKKELYDILT